MMTVFSLTACGSGEGNSATGSGSSNGAGSGSSAAGSGSSGSSSAAGSGNAAGSGRSAGDALTRGVQDVARGTENAVSDATGGMLRGASYDQMLRNAHVHDTDGNLYDYENAMTPGTRYF